MSILYTYILGVLTGLLLYHKMNEEKKKGTPKKNFVVS